MLPAIIVQPKLWRLTTQPTLVQRTNFWFRISTTQRLGTTIITVDPRSGKAGLFFQGSSPIGFTLALTIARAGLVFAGSLPTSGGTAEPGPLDVIDAKGHLLRRLGSK